MITKSVKRFSEKIMPKQGKGRQVYRTRGEDRIEISTAAAMSSAMQSASGAP